MRRPVGPIISALQLALSSVLDQTVPPERGLGIPPADGFGETDWSDGTSSKTTSSRAYKGVFEENPSEPVSRQVFSA